MRVWQASLLATEFDAHAKLLLKQLAVGYGGNEVYPKWLGRHATNGLDLLAFQAGRFENHAVTSDVMTAVMSSDRASPANIEAPFSVARISPRWSICLDFLAQMNLVLDILSPFGDMM